MKRLILITALILGFIAVTAVNPACAQKTGKKYTQSELNLILAMRALWQSHVVWTRQYIIGTVDGLKDVKPVADRLMKNQEDIGNAIVPFYGADAGSQLTGLLKEHIMGAVNVLAAAKKGDDKGLAEAQKKWRENADRIAGFLAGANPAWTKESLTAMLYEHLTLTTEEAVDRLKKDYPADIAVYDKIVDRILAMADGLSFGIIKQFPDKFLE